MYRILSFDGGGNLELFPCVNATTPSGLQLASNGPDLEFLKPHLRFVKTRF